MTRRRGLGFFGALVDAIGGGGWGPVVTSNLLARGNGASFQRSAYRRSGRLPEVINDAVAVTELAG